MQDKFLLMGSNKSFLRFAKNKNTDEEFLQYAEFYRKRQINLKNTARI